MRKTYICEVVDEHGIVIGSHIIQLGFFAPVMNAYGIMKKDITGLYGKNKGMINFRRIK